MASIFRKDDNFVDKPNRNSFDMSFQNNLTTKFGVLKPVYCQEVIPGDSFKIRPDFALRFLPMKFPVQTRMRAHLHFFYVRNRTIWKDWMDFIGKTKEGLVPPYLSINENNKEMLNVGNLADMFGLPVVLNNDQWIQVRISDEDENQNPYYYDFETGSYSDGLYPYFMFSNNQDNGLLDNSVYLAKPFRYQNIVVFPSFNLPLTFDEEFEFITSKQASSDAIIIFKVDFGTSISYIFIKHQIPAGTDMMNTIDLGHEAFDGALKIQPLGALWNDLDECIFNINYKPSLQPNGIPLSSLPVADINNFIGSSVEPISALPFRAYEAIYNSFYRNAENNPYILNGVPEYNKYIPTFEGGADSNIYVMHNRNWEDDFLTTAVQSPQQGNAPLVGLTSTMQFNPVVVFANDDGTKTELSLVTGQEGEIFAVEGEFNAQDEYANTLANALRDGAVNFGLRINDLRDVNSFQRWLENNIRKGYKYRDQIKGHYGVTVRYDELDMPEFIGGVSRDVSVQQVTQTVKNEFGELGEFGGQSYVMGSGETINQYCDEHGFIIGILSVVPMANYSQLIPKYLLKRDALDYYFPEFGKIGMQPILNKEVTFLESIDEGKKDEVFGYQRAWYDYLARTDEVHGLFRTDLRNFLVGRTFDSLPQLSVSFSTIQNDQLNNIFYVDDDSDKILGQIYFDVTAVRPIPVYGIPSLE